MKYPMACNWLTYKIIEDGSRTMVKDILFEEEHLLDTETATFLQKLDGNANPYKIDNDLSKQEVECILQTLKERCLVRDSKTLFKTFGSLYRTLFIMKSCNKKCRNRCRKLNACLLIFWLPILIAALKYFWAHLDAIGSLDHITLGSIVFLIIGVCLHEIGHGLSAIAYGGQVFEAGVKISLLPGAYVMYDVSNVKSRANRIQTLAAGIEMNCVLSSVLFFLLIHLPAFSGFFLGGAIMNLVLALINLLFIEGLDGAKILSELLGDDDIFTKAKETLFNGAKRKKTLKSGIGLVRLSMCFSLIFFQIMLPILIVINLLGVLV